MQTAANRHMDSRRVGQAPRLRDCLFRRLHKPHGEVGVGRARLERGVEARRPANRGQGERSPLVACEERLHDIDVLGARDGARGEDDAAARGNMGRGGLQKRQAGLRELVNLLGVQTPTDLRVAAQCAQTRARSVDEHDVEGTFAHHVVEYRRVAVIDSETWMPYSSARSQ